VLPVGDHQVRERLDEETKSRFLMKTLHAQLIFLQNQDRHKSEHIDKREGKDSLDELWLKKEV
jgi:hypothetical protein